MPHKPPTIQPSTTFTSTNPILDKDQVGLENDTGKFKVGDGATRWSSLAYELPGLSSVNLPAGVIADVPLSGSRVVLFGHSLTAGGGVSGNNMTRSWQNILAGSLRGRLWDQGVGGAVLARSSMTRGTTGWGGVREVLQGLVPNPYTGTCWKGAYNAATAYSFNDGVSSGGNWYRNESPTGSIGAAPPGGPWVQVTPGPQTQPGEAGAPFYLPIARLPIFWYGNNDIGLVYQSNEQPFLTAMETILARACASMVFDASSPMITYTGAGFSLVANNYAGSGTSIEAMSAVGGSTISFTTPPDWPGGYVDFLYLGLPGTVGVVAFTVDGNPTNVLNSGSGGGSTVDFGNPDRSHRDTTALTTALAAGVAVTQLNVLAIPHAVNAGNNIVVGPPGSTDTFVVATGGAAANATVIPVNSQAPVHAHPINDPVYASANNVGWAYNWLSTVRIPTAAGSHTVVGTLQAAPAMAGLYFGGVSLESPTPPPIIIPSLIYLTNYIIYWNNRQVNDALIDTWNTALKNLVAQFPSAYYMDTTTLTRPGAKLTVPLGAGQAGINQLQVQPLPYAIATGDYIEIGSGVTQQEVQASGPAAIGALTIPVSAFTSAYAQPIGTWVWDSNVVEANISNDDVHMSDLGHEILAAAFVSAVRIATAAMTQQQLARITSTINEPVSIQRLSTANLTVGTGTASQWGAVKMGAAIPTITIPCDPGDVIEIDLEGAYSNVTGDLAFMDLVTWDTVAAAPINYVSGSTYAGNAGTSGLGGDSVGAHLTNGLPSLLSSGIAGEYDRLVGRFSYIVQTADIRTGGVTFALWGQTSTAATVAILAQSPTNAFFWQVRNKGPMSYLASSS